MFMHLKPILIGATTAVLSVMGVGSWYVFIAGAPQLDPPAAEVNTNLTFKVESVMSRSLGQLRKYGVVLPPGYDSKQKTAYPVIILLHGGHGTERDYEDKARLTSVLHDLYSQKKLPPSIVITPDGNDLRGSSALWDPQYIDGKHGKVATFLGQELVHIVQSRYHTLKDPQFWAIGGLSSGGWGALNIGLHYPQQFRTLFSHTGYFVDKSGPNNSPQKFIQTLPEDLRSQLKIYLDAGESDHKYLEATRSFHETLDQLGINNTFNVFPGGHGIVGPDVGWNYWHKHLMDSLSFVGQQFKTALAEKAVSPVTPAASTPPIPSKSPSPSKKSANLSHHAEITALHR